MKNAEVEKIHHWSALVGQLGWLKNSCSHLKLILWCSLPDVIPHIKLHPNRMKNAVEKIHHWSALVGQLGRSKNSRSHLKLILCCSLPDVVPHIKFHQTETGFMKSKDAFWWYMRLQTNILCNEILSTVYFYAFVIKWNMLRITWYCCQYRTFLRNAPKDDDILW